MADRLTQLQDCLDKLLTDMYASLTYIQHHHPYGTIEGQPSQAPAPEPAPTSAVSLPNGSPTTQSQPTERQQHHQHPIDPDDHIPEDPQIFQRNMREMAQVLVNTEHQIEYIINSLPGLGNTEKDQVERMRELEGELREVEEQRRKAEGERERLLEGLGRVVVGGRRVG